MKKYYLFASLVLLAASPAFAQTKIGAAGAPDASAMLEVTSGAANNKGLLLPKMTTVQRNTIVSPANGLMIYNTTANEVQVNTGTPIAPTWAAATATATGWATAGNTGTTPATNFIGTTDNQPLSIRTNNTEQVRVTETGYVGIGTNAPIAKLHVIDTGNVYMVVGSSSTAGMASVSLGNGHHGMSRNLTSSGGIPNDVALYTTSSSVPASLYLAAKPGISDSIPLTQFALKSTGNVGIGIKDPTTKLHVDGGSLTISNNNPISSSAINVISDNTGGINPDNISITTYGPASPVYGVSAARGTAAAPLNSQAGDNTGGLWFAPRINGAFNATTRIVSQYVGDGTTLNSKLFFVTSDQTSMVIDSSSFVGIGTNTPMAKLHVVDSGDVDIRVGSITGNTTGIARFSMGNGNHGMVRNLISSGGITNDVAIYTSSASVPASLYLAAKPGISDSIPLTQFALKSTGNVGIGIKDPTAKLHVNGGGLTITNNGAISGSAINVISDNGGAVNPDNISITTYGPAVQIFGVSAARGTAAAPLNSQAGDNTGGLWFAPRINGAFNQITRIASQYMGDGTTLKSKLFFVTSDQTNMVIDSSGFVGIGTNAPAYALHVIGDINASASVRANGVVLTSDARLKRNITNSSYGLNTVMDLRPVVYDKKNSIPETNYDRHEIGFIAQEIAKVLPFIVTEGKDADKTLAVSYTELIPVLTKAIQEQQAEIDALKAKNVQLEAVNKTTAQLVERVKQMEQMIGIKEIEGTSKVAGK